MKSIDVNVGVYYFPGFVVDVVALIAHLAPARVAGNAL
jgi:hypothetical protein